MFRTPQKRGGAANPFTTPHGSPHKTVPLNGLFSDATWKCNCDPRLPAAHFQVKKEGRNKGRWFYTCQRPKNDEGCGFFLWDEDAVGREMRAVINNSRTEPDGLRTPADAAREKKATGSASSDSIQDFGKGVDDEFGEFPLSVEDAEAVAGKVDDHTAQAAPCSETPRKATKADLFTTPGSKRKRDVETLPTPMTNASRDDDVFTTSTGRLKGFMWDGNERFGLRSPSATPTPSRFGDTSDFGEVGDERPKNEYDITLEVMELLKNQHIDEDAKERLRQLLGKHALRTAGIAKGRDITRVALKTKDVKIAELQQKVTTLTSEREMDKAVIQQFKSVIAESIASTRDRSRERGAS